MEKYEIHFVGSVLDSNTSGDEQAKNCSSYRARTFCCIRSQRLFLCIQCRIESHALCL